MQIYCIKNKINGKCYVGQTVRSFEQRYSAGKWWIHSKNQALLNASKKYGHENFEISILVEGDFSLQELNLLEIAWSNELKSCSPTGYNLKECGDSKKATLEMRIKMSLAKKGKSTSLKGVPKSEELKKKISQTLTGRPQPWNKRKRTDDQKRAHSEKMKGRQAPNKGKKGQKAWNKGLRGAQQAWNKGIPITPEALAKRQETRRLNRLKAKSVQNDII